MVQNSGSTTKVYTQKELVLPEKSITHFNEKYIPEIQKLEFHLPHVRILGTHHRGKKRCEAFKLWGNLHYVLCSRGFLERVVSIFSHQIQS